MDGANHTSSKPARGPSEFLKTSLENLPATFEDNGNRTAPPSFPRPKTLENNADITISPSPAASVEDPKKGAVEGSSFPPTLQKTGAEGALLDSSSSPSTLVNSTLTGIGYDESFHTSEASRWPSNSSKFYGAKTVPPSSAEVLKGEEIYEHYSLSYLYAPTAAPTKGKKGPMTLTPSDVHYQILPTAAGNITFTHYDGDTTLPPVPVMSPQETSPKYIGNETFNYYHEDASPKGNLSSEIARSSIDPNINETFSLHKPLNFDSMTVSPTLASIVDDNSTPTSPMLDSPAEIKRPLTKGSRDWK